MEPAFVACYVPKSQRSTKPSVAGIFQVNKKKKKSVIVNVDECPAFFKNMVEYNKYPESLKRYINKCFGMCKNENEKKIISKDIINKIKKVAGKGLLSNHNWDNESVVAITNKPKLAFDSSKVLKNQIMVNDIKEKMDNEDVVEASFCPAQQILFKNQKKDKLDLTAKNNKHGFVNNNSAQEVNKVVKSSNNKKKEKNKQKKSKVLISNTQSNDDIKLNIDDQLIGTSKSLEKPYFRLAGDTLPDISEIRPLSVLKKSLNYCLKKFAKNNDYDYICEQLRSIRQDLLVQRIEDEFCVKVYETHSILAIKHHDLENLNQSMTSLETLYGLNFGVFDHICKFYGYRILYLIGVDDINGMYSFIPKIPENILMSNEIQFALKVWKASSCGEYTTFFNLMKEATPLCASVMSIKADYMRFLALSESFKSMRRISLSGYTEILNFKSENETREYLIHNDIPIPE